MSSKVIIDEDILKVSSSQELKEKFIEVIPIGKIKELQTLFGIDKTIISNLETIRRDLVPNCKHPKKMRDRTADGQMYCMNCNLDI